MGKSTDRQFREAEAASKCAVATFVSAIDQMMGCWDDVGPHDILELVLLELSEELPKRMDTGQTQIPSAAIQCAG